MKKMLFVLILAACVCAPLKITATPCSDAAEGMFDFMKTEMRRYKDQVVMVTLMKERVVTGWAVIALGKDGKPKLFDISKLSENMTDAQISKLSELTKNLKNAHGVHIEAKTKAKDFAVESEVVKGVTVGDAKSKAAKELGSFLNSL